MGAADALQDCVDRAAPFSSIDIPSGVYTLRTQVVISKALTIRTAGGAGHDVGCVANPDQCATLMADPHLYAPHGMLLVRVTTGARLEHLVLDGNRAARLDTPAARSCRAGQNSLGFNVAVLECTRCAVEDVVSMNALCGTGMAWIGGQAVIRRSEFRANGDASTPRMWADGLTLLFAPDSDISDNRFIDNSDIGLIVGYGVRSRVEGNLVVQRAQPAFAGLMLDNFNSNDLHTRGDFRGAVVTRNTIDCGAQLCVFGIQVGPRPWYPAQNIIGGELHDNEVRGAKIGINVDGAGVRMAPTAVFANSVSGVPDRAYFSDCARSIPTHWLNVGPSSVVDRRDELTEAGATLSDPCQLHSDVAVSETR